MIWIEAVALSETPYEVSLRFSNQESRLINLKPYLWGTMFEPLHQLELFNQVSVDPESETIVWPNGADFAPAFLWDNSQPLPLAHRG